MLLDFGIAKVLISDADTSPVSEITHIGGRALTLQYAAPEQVLNKPIGITTDVWALGVLLYRLMTDTLPFGEGERSTVEHNILTLTPPMPSQCNSGVISQVEKYKATGLDYVILKAIHKDPSQRIQ